MRLTEPRYWNLLWELTRTDFKLRDQGTVLGFLWTLLHPALMFVVLYLLFTKWVGKFVDNYAAYLIIGIVQWQFFEKATSFSLSSLRRKAMLARNFKFPKEIIVLSSVGCVFWSYLLELAVLLLFLFCLGIRPSLCWLALPCAVCGNLLLTLGASLSLSLLAVLYEDIERIWSILTLIGFYMTPIFYPLSILTPGRQELLKLNPMLHVIDAFRFSLIGAPIDVHSGFLYAMLLGAGLSVGALILFRRDPPWIIDRIVEP
jgi:ABC-type polysaccharide/polyol phosphate export permease